MDHRQVYLVLATLVWLALFILLMLRTVVALSEGFQSVQELLTH